MKQKFKLLILTVLLTGCSALTQTPPTPSSYSDITDNCRKLDTNTLGFDVSLNGRSLGRVGADDMVSGGITINAVGKLGPNSRPLSPIGCQTDNYLVFATACGLSKDGTTGKNIFKEWFSQISLRVGDTISVTVIEADKFDTPSEVDADTLIASNPPTAASSDKTK